MRPRKRVIRAILLRELASYFGTPTGYVFITLFVFLSAMAAFWQERFFSTNLANLDQLNRFFPYLLIFLAPAITMSLWSEEKKQGTEELLLTLPATDMQIVLGKYLAALAIYSVALAFSLSHIVVLCWLGSPDPGLMFSTYLGYWLMGAALLSLGMLASALTANLTIAFILGALFCSIPVFLDFAGAIVSGAPQRLAEKLSVIEQFRDLSNGVITLAPLVYFVSFALAVLYLNVILLGSHRRFGSPAPNLRGCADTSLRPHALADRHNASAVSRCSPPIPACASTPPPSRSIRSRPKPKHSYGPSTGASPSSSRPISAPTCRAASWRLAADLVSMLREFDGAAQGADQTKLVEPVTYSPHAREAQERYGIRPFRVPAAEESARAANEIFLGLTFTSGSEEFVIPFFDRGLPVEYELMRSIRVISHARRKKIGILDTPAKLFGGLDFQTKVQANEWSIVAELRKQYEVAQVSPDVDYPEDLDTLVAAQPSALSEAQTTRLTDYVKRGKPALLLVDPMPAFNLELAPKNNLHVLMDLLGMTWQFDRIAWDNYNPHPQLKRLPKEVVFIGKGFNQRDAITAGLQEAVLLYPGVLKSQGGGPPFVPLLTTSPDSGTVRFDDLVQRSPFGVAINEAVVHQPDEGRHVRRCPRTRPRR